MNVYTHMCMYILHVFVYICLYSKHLHINSLYVTLYIMWICICLYTGITGTVASIIAKQVRFIYNMDVCIYKYVAHIYTYI